MPTHGVHRTIGTAFKVVVRRAGVRPAGGGVGHLVASHLGVSFSKLLDLCGFVRGEFFLSAAGVFGGPRAHRIFGDVVGNLTSLSGPKTPMTRVTVRGIDASRRASHLFLRRRRQRITSSLGGGFALLKPIGMLAYRGDHKNGKRWGWLSL